MSPGKIASQAGHAYLGAYLQALQLCPETAQLYCAEHPVSPGTKVCLQGTLAQLITAKKAADEAGLPTFMVVDSGCENFFEGEPTVTALGIGPALSNQLPTAAKKLNLL